MEGLLAWLTLGAQRAKGQRGWSALHLLVEVEGFPALQAPLSLHQCQTQSRPSALADQLLHQRCASHPDTWVA